MSVCWSDIKTWLDSGVTPTTDFDFAAHLDGFINDPFDTDNNTDLRVANRLKLYDWSRSFYKPQVVYLDERVTSESIIKLHTWFRQQACNIENILLITTHVLGLKEFWKNYLATTNQRGFQIHEWPFCRTKIYEEFFNPLPEFQAYHVLEKRQNLQWYFNWYAGFWPKHDRSYYTLKIAEFENLGFIDAPGKFVMSRQDFLDYAMWCSYFDADEESKITELYDQYVKDHQLITNSTLPTYHQPKFKEKFFAGYQWQVDQQCFATVPRETDLDQPFSMLTEKTLRGFIHGCAVIPTGYQSIEHMQQWGFWFPQDIIDYTYQFEKDTLGRFNKMMASIKQLASSYTLAELTDYQNRNWHRFVHNAELVKKYLETDIDYD